jgi:hypothetical protein
MKQLTLTSASAVVIAVIICWEVPFDAAAAAGNEASYHHQQQRRRLPRIYHRGRGNTTTKLIPSSFSFLHHYQHDQHYLYRQIRHRTSQQYQSAVADCRRGGNQLFVSSSTIFSLMQRQQVQQQQQQQQRRRLERNAINNIGHNGNCDSNDDGNNIQLCQRTLDAALSKFSIISHANFASTFNKHRMNSVQVKPSNIANAGMGLFATKNIKKGSIVSFYPVDSIGIEDVESESGDMTTTTTIVRSRTEGNVSNINNNNTGGINDQVYLLHIVGNRPLMKMDVMNDLGGSSIFINVDVDVAVTPTSPSGRDEFDADSNGTTTSLSSASSSVGFDSHRVNDGATVISNTELGALSYYQTSRAAANCVHVPFGPSPLLATVTTRKVKKGEELLTTYGCLCKLFIVSFAIFTKSTS